MCASKKIDKFEKSWILYVYAVLHVSTAGPTQGLLITHDFWKKIFYTHEIKKEKKNKGTILVKWGILSIFHISMFQIGEKYKRRRCSVQVSRMINLKSPEFCMYMEEWHEDQYCPSCHERTDNPWNKKRKRIFSFFKCTVEEEITPESVGQYWWNGNFIHISYCPCFRLG